MPFNDRDRSRSAEVSVDPTDHQLPELFRRPSSASSTASSCPEPQDLIAQNLRRLQIESGLLSHRPHERSSLRKAATCNMQSDTTARRLAECKNASAALKDRDDAREKAWQTLKSCATRVSQAGSNTTDLSDREWDRAVSDLDEAWTAAADAGVWLPDIGSPSTSLSQGELRDVERGTEMAPRTEEDYRTMGQRSHFEAIFGHERQ